MRIAGVYASAFLLFGRKKKIFFLIFRIVVNVRKHETIFYFVSTKTRNSVIALPRPSTRSGIPPSKTLST